MSTRYRRRTVFVLQRGLPGSTNGTLRVAKPGRGGAGRLQTRKAAKRRALQLAAAECAVEEAQRVSEAVAARLAKLQASLAALGH